MAKDIHLTGAGKQPPKPPAAMPPPAKDFGFGTPPMPEGQVVGNINPSSLTPAERRKLESIGWTPDIPIPANMAEILAKVQREKQAQLDQVVLPVSPDTPKLNIVPKQLETLSPAEQKEILDVMAAATAVQEAQRQMEADQARREAQGATVPGMKEALRVAEAVAAAGKTQEQKAPGKEEAFRIDQDAEPATLNAAQPSPHAFCPHCGWDQSAVDIAEPPYADKLSFLHSLLGQKPWLKDMPLFGGNVVATFRTLSMGEIDTIYKQAYQDRSDGLVPTEIDFWERVNRFRLFLQLQMIRSVNDPNGFSHDLPDGLSRATNASARAFWEHPGDTFDGATSLPSVEKHITENVLKTEAVFRTVHQACNQFNRLVAKMEAMADNQNFWQPTAEPS